MPRPLLENTMTFKIDKGLPMPNISKGRPRIYPFPEMEVGDSFAVPITDDASLGNNANTSLLRSAATAYSRKHDVKFSVTFDRSKKVTRCWRIK